MRDFCPLCLHQRVFSKELQINEVMFRKNDSSYLYLSCEQCETIYLSSELSSEEIENAYPNSYYSQAHDPERIVILGNQILAGWVLKVFLTLPNALYRLGYSLGPSSQIRNLLRMVYAAGRSSGRRPKGNKNSRRYLDVGTGSGILPAFLSQSQSQSSEWIGIDPFLRKELDTDQLKLCRESLEQHGSQRLRDLYDVISFNHSLEHLDNPEGEIRSAVGLLKDSGRLLIRIPNAGSIAYRRYGQNWFQIDAPRHSFIPTLKGLAFLSKRCGLEIIDTWCDSSSTQFWMSRRVSKGLAMTIQMEGGQHTFASRPLYDVKRLGDYIYTAYANKVLQGDQLCIVLKRSSQID